MSAKNSQNNQLRSGETLPPLTRTMDLVRSSLDEESRTVEVTFSTETPVERWFGLEILDHGADAVRMGRMSDKAPFLMDHNWADQRGVVESAEVKGKEGRAKVRFSRSERGEELMQEVKDGIRTKISVGYRVHTFLVTQNADGPDEYRATDWEPFEISSVAIPADTGAKTRSEFDQLNPFGSRAAELSTKVFIREADNSNKRSNMAKKPTDTPPAEEQNRSENPETPEQLAAPEVQGDTPETRGAAPDPAEIQKEVARQVEQETERREEIQALGRQFNLSEADVREHIKAKRSVDEVKLAIIEAQRNDPANAPIPSVRAEQRNAPTGERGTREYLEQRWGESAVSVLRAAGHPIEMPSRVRVISEQAERNYIDGTGRVFHRSLTGALTLADVAVLDAGIGAPIISEVTAHAPELAVFPVDVISGATVELSVATALPTVGARNANEGTDWKKGTFESRIFQTAIIEERVGVDIQGVLNASRNPGRLLAAEAGAVTRAVAEHVGKQTWYGATAQSGADAKFAPGIYAQANTAATHVVDATGTTGKTSIWFLELGDMACGHIYGNDTTLNFRDSWMEETIEDANGKKLRALTNYLSGRVAARLANKNAAVRIKNVTAETGKGATDALMFSALKLCNDLGMSPNAIFMTSRSQYQLQASRTTYSPVGLPAPLPNEFQGIPIYVTRNLSNAETI